jgi:hypothetical protein
MANNVSDLGHFANAGLDDFSQWLPQNDFQFDPQLFGGYRDPQENILPSGFDDSFFNDALDMDFITPYNLPVTSPPAPKKDLIAQIDAAKEDDESAPTNQLLKCNDVWYVWLTRNPLLRRPTNKLTGRKFRSAPRLKAAILTWTGFARTCRRRPSVTALAPSSARMISRLPSRSICARTTKQRPLSMRLPRRWRRSQRLEVARLAPGTTLYIVQQDRATGPRPWFPGLLWWHTGVLLDTKTHRQGA